MSTITAYSSVSELISAGFIPAPVQVIGEHSGRLINATIELDGSFTFLKENFNSPSVSAGRAITIVTGFSTPGRNYQSVNGWKFWHIKFGKETISLAQIRHQAILSQI